MGQTAKLKREMVHMGQKVYFNIQHLTPLIRKNADYSCNGMHRDFQSTKDEDTYLTEIKIMDHLRDNESISKQTHAK